MSAPTIPHITCEHLLSLHGKPVDEREHAVIDLRDQSDWDAGHIEGSHHVPHKELSNLESLVPDKDKHVIVVLGPTQDGEIEKVHEQLKAMGYGNSEFLAGGIDRWCEVADVEIADVVDTLTPEEAGMRGEGEDDIGPAKEDAEPMY